MKYKSLLLIKYYGSEEATKEISNHLAQYEQCETEELKDLAIKCGIDKLKVNYFLYDDHYAKLLDVSNYGPVATACFVCDPWSSFLLIMMAQKLKGSCKFAWESWGNSPYSARFYDEDLPSYTQEVLVRAPDAYNDEEDYNLEDPDDSYYYYERQDLDLAIDRWCGMIDFDREDRTDEQMLEYINNSNENGDYQIYAFAKETNNPLYEHQARAKVMLSGDMDVIEELYNAALNAIEEHGGSFIKFVEEYDEDEDYINTSQLLDAQLSENDDGNSVLELSVLSYFQHLNVENNIDVDIFADFSTLQSYFADNNDVELSLNIWQVTDFNLATDCELEDEEVAQVGYLYVDAQDEFGEDGKFLMCDHVESLIDRWCDLVGYEGERKEGTDMLELINNYSYHNANTSIKAGLVVAKE